MSEKYLVKETLLYSDGSETVVNFKKNNEAETIEKVVEIEVALHRGETPLEEFVAPEPLPNDVEEVKE